MSLKTLWPQIQEAWDHRINQNIEPCFEKVAWLKQEMGISSLELVDQERVRLLFEEYTSERVLLLDVISLFASTERLLGHSSRHEKMMKISEDLVFQYGVFDSFYFYFERGISFYAVGDFSPALEAFLKAESIASQRKNLQQEFIASANLTFCLENLGFPYQKVLDRVKVIMQKLDRSDFSKQVFGQIQLLEMRNFFLNGEFRSFLHEGKLSQQPDYQSIYYLQYLRQLPYHAYFKANEESAIEPIQNLSAHFFHKRFRLGTLQGAIHPDDQSNSDIKPSELIDRIYLWTWNWLRDSQKYSIDKVFLMLENLNLDLVLGRMTVEDKQILRNALLWISLFTPLSVKRIGALLDKLKPIEFSHPLLELESLVVHYFIASRDGSQVLVEDYHRLMTQHPLWNKSDLLFKCLVLRSQGEGEKCGGEDFSLDLLAQKLSGFLFKENDSRNLKHVSVRMRTFSIIEKDSGRKTISVPLCFAFDLLYRKKTVSCQEFLDHCFSIPNYDASIHSTKIYNLLARMKKLTGGALRFGIKSEMVYAEGSWEDVEVQGNVDIATASGVSSAWNSFLRIGGTQEESTSSKEKSKHQDWFKELTRFESFGRRHFENVSGLPRSTANRVLDRWVKNRWLVKMGAGRSTQYRFVVHAQEKLFKGEIQC